MRLHPRTIRIVQRLISVALVAAVLMGTLLHYLPIGERDVQLDITTLWAESNVWGDAGAYLAQATDFDLSMAPYKYRILPTLAVRAIDAPLGVPPILGYLILNCLCFMITGVGFTAYLQRWYHYRYGTALAGGLLAVTTLSIQSMTLLPMAEPASYVAALAGFWAFQTRRPVVFGVTVALAVLTKEVFIILVVVWVVRAAQRPSSWSASGGWWQLVAVGLPIAAFMGVRMLFQDSPVSVNYGLPATVPVEYLARFSTPALWPDLIWRLWLTLGPLWIGLGPLLVKWRSRLPEIVYVALAVLATLLLSSRIPRVLGIVYIVVLPEVLAIVRWAERRTGREDDERTIKRDVPQLLLEGEE